jgi:hypothetical protein
MNRAVLKQPLSEECINRAFLDSIKSCLSNGSTKRYQKSYRRYEGNQMRLNLRKQK